MKIAGIQIRRRFFVTVGLIVTVTGAWYYWSRMVQTVPPPASRRPPEPFVKLAGTGQRLSDRVLEEEAEYFDPTPLFLPTSKNFGQGPLPARVVKQPGQVFRDFPSVLNFGETSLANFGKASEASGSTLPEVLTRGNEAPFAGFGQVDSAQVPLERREGYIEIKSLMGGSLYLSGPVKTPGLPHVDYDYVEFIVAVASTGLIGDPVMITGSGRDDIDVKVRDFLVKTYRIGEKLVPGRYIVSVGP